MNLHDIPDSTEAALREFDVAHDRWDRFWDAAPFPTREWFVSPAGRSGRNRLTQDLYDDIRRAVTDVEGTFPQTPPVPQRYIVHPQLVRDLILDIVRFRERLMVAGVRERELERLAYVVTREEYSLLREYAFEFLAGTVVVDHATGTLRVHGVTVIPR